MIDLLRRAAEHRGSAEAVITPAGVTTYAALLHHAETAAAHLTAASIDRFAIVDDDPARVFALLAGAHLAGAEPCVYPTAATDEVVAEYRDLFDHEHLVTSRPSLLASGAHAVADLLADTEATVPDGPPEQAPLLVLTTGTTGVPKAARHTWDRLLRTTTRLRPVDGQRWLLAYGLNQFGGLQILLHVAAAQTTVVSGETFQPRDALAAMRRWGVTHASGTPTFWRFLLIEMSSDGGPAPDLVQVTLGGEAVPAGLIDRLTAQFPTARMSQIYGANEFGQNVSVRDGVAGLPVSLLDEGGDVVLKVVDGELWVRSRAAMHGYYGHDALDPDTWRPTGDLVEIVGDRIEFRGRLSDVINVGGVKVHPLPVEERALSVDGVQLARAFGRPNPMVGSIVALEIVADTSTDTSTLEQRVREACADLPPAARPRSITRVESMGTTGNKLSRASAG